MENKAKDFLSKGIPISDGQRKADGTMPPQRGRLSVRGLRCDTYRGFAPVADGGFIITKPLGEDALLCALIDPAGRGPTAVEIGARLKETVDGLLGADFLRYAERKPAEALDRLDAVLDQTMDELSIPGAMAMMSAMIVNAKMGRYYLFCRGMDGAAGLRAGGTPLWATGGDTPPYGVMPRDFLFMRGKPAPKCYNLLPGDTLVLTNSHVVELPEPYETSEKSMLPILAARAAKGGRLEAGGLAIMFPPPVTEGPSLPERMALATHALRLAGLAANPSIERGDLTLEATQEGCFEAICRASGLHLPEPTREDGNRVRYAEASPLAVKGLLAASIRREAL